MLPLAVATSIDALAVGVTFAFLTVDIVPAVSFIGVITFCLLPWALPSAIGSAPATNPVRNWPAVIVSGADGLQDPCWSIWACWHFNRQRCIPLCFVA